MARVPEAPVFFECSLVSLRIQRRPWQRQAGLLSLVPSFDTPFYPRDGIQHGVLQGPGSQDAVREEQND